MPVCKTQGTVLDNLLRELGLRKDRPLGFSAPPREGWVKRETFLIRVYCIISPCAASSFSCEPGLAYGKEHILEQCNGRVFRDLSW